MPENQILISDWTYFHCPDSTLAYNEHKSAATTNHARRKMSTKVFVTGGSGYIGYHVSTTHLPAPHPTPLLLSLRRKKQVARALRRNGFRVYALVRDEAKAAALRRDEIIPVIG